MKKILLSLAVLFSSAVFAQQGAPGQINPEKVLNEMSTLAENISVSPINLLPVQQNGRIKPLVDKVFPLQDLPKAREFMESNSQVGKIVLKVQ